MRRSVSIGLVVLFVLLTGCGGSDENGNGVSFDDRVCALTRNCRVDRNRVAEVDNTVVVESEVSAQERVVTKPNPACEPGPGKKVTQIEDVVVPAIVEPGYRVDDASINGVPIPGFVVAPVSIPEQVVDAGCIIEHDAPAGCLGAVEITGFEVPGFKIAGFEIPPVQVPGLNGQLYQTFAGQVVEDVIVEDIVIEGVRAEQQCPPAGSEYVSRSALYRNSAYSDSSVRSRLAANRPPICVDTQPPGCIDAAGIPGLTVPPLEVPPVTVDAAELPSPGG